MVDLKKIQYSKTLQVEKDFNWNFLYLLQLGFFLYWTVCLLKLEFTIWTFWSINSKSTLLLLQQTQIWTYYTGHTLNLSAIKSFLSKGQFSASIFLLGIFIKAYLPQGDFIANIFSVTPNFLLQNLDCYKWQSATLN